jgi:dCMP deaminase
MPDEDVSRAIVEQYALKNVTFESVFLRWDKMPTLRENIIAPHRKITTDEFARSMMSVAIAESTKSSDWWRQIGTAIVRDGAVIALSHNKHLPTDYHLAINGDPRTIFDAGQHIDIATSIHSEALAVAQSAKNGVSLNGAEAFVTTFPCPNCARLLAEAGIQKVYYQKGYSLLDAEEILKAYGIEVVMVISEGVTS